jgi:hypothetical protein
MSQKVMKLQWNGLTPVCSKTVIVLGLQVDLSAVMAFVLSHPQSFSLFFVNWMVRKH